jgi:hypothetical protein
MAMYPNDPEPFWGLIGHTATVDMADIAVAFVAFYHQLASGAGISQAVDAMRVASGDNGFMFQDGPTSKQVYIDYVASQNPQQIAPRIGGLGGAGRL